MTEKAACTIQIDNLILESEADIQKVADALKALKVLGHKHGFVNASSHPIKGFDESEAMTKHESILEAMRRFGIPFMNAAGELIIDVKENVYCSTEGLETIEEIEASIVMSLTRPIYKGLPEKKALALLDRINERYNTLLTRDDMGDMYNHLCFWRLLPMLQQFIADGFPMDKVAEYAKGAQHDET